jgi:hypothetical protein
LTIYGAAGSYAQQYARENNIPFSIVDQPADWAVDAVNRGIAEGFILPSLQSNYGANITRADFSVALAESLIPKHYDWFVDCANRIFSSSYVSPFTDVSNDSFETLGCIDFLSSLGIVNGIGDGLFNPYGEITRQEAATMLKRAAVKFGVSDSKAVTAFEDQWQVADWAIDALGFVVDKGIMIGTGDNRFSPLDTYTREQAYVTIMRLYDIVPVTVAP